MSDDVVWGGKRNKRMNVEELKTDYSGVYLQNEKLEQALNRFLEKLQKDRKRLKEQHEQELYQVKKEVESMNVFLQTTNSLDLLNNPLTAASTIRIPVPKRPELNRDPTTFPEKWFTSVFIPTDKELIKIKRQRSTHPPLPFIRRSKTDMAKRKQKEKEEKEEEESEERSSFISKKASIEDNAKSLVINRSKTEIGHLGAAVPTFGQPSNEQRPREPSRLSLTRSNRGSASIYAGHTRDSIASGAQNNVLPDFMTQRNGEASGRSRLNSQGSSRFAERGREPSGRSIARSLGKRDDAELRLPQMSDHGGLDESPDIEAQTATVVTRSVRELRAMALSNQNTKLPSSEMLRNQRMLDSTRRKNDRILTKMRTFIKTFEEEMGENGDDKRPKLVDFVL